MRLSPLQARADLVGRRVVLEWSWTLEGAETLASIPAVRVRRKLRDFQYPAAEPGEPDPFLLFDSAAFPPAGSSASELPARERFEAGSRVLTTITSAARPGASGPVEVLRLTETTTYDPGGRPLSRRVELLDAGGTLGSPAPGVVHYYELSGPPPAPGADPDDRRAVAAPGEAYGLGRTLYEMLPSVHHRHDTLTRAATPGAEAVMEAGTRGGQLRRFVDLFGTPLDLMRSTAEGLRGLHDVENADHRWLPWMARWVGWSPGFSLPIPQRRNEIRFAPALHRLTGTLPSAVVRVRMATGWRSRVKEYTHNVFTTNRPEELNLWPAERTGPDAWAEPLEPLTLDPVHAGRASAAAEADGTVWLLYQAFRMNRWGIWYKTWREGEGWSSGLPLTAERGLERSPAAAVTPDGTLWTFWAAWDEAAGRWGIRFRTRAPGGAWTDPAPFGDAGAERREPAATVDGQGGLWLFWTERMGRAWRIHYARFAGGAWSVPTGIPGPGGVPEAAEGHPSVVFFPTGPPSRRLWVFWQRTVEGAEPGQTRTVIVSRVKGSLLPDTSEWFAAETLSALPPAWNDADPCAFGNADGELELFWASDRAQGWSVWRRAFDAGAQAWGAPAQVTGDAFTERYPLPVLAGGRDVLLHRSNRAPVFGDPAAGGIRSVDFRYAGSTTAHARNPEKAALRGGFDDFAAYTSDFGEGGGRGDADRYAHDTVGIFLDPGVADGAQVAAGIGRVRQVAPEFLPVTERAVYAVEPGVHAEFVYDYARPGAADPRLVAEGYADALDSVLVAEAFPDGLDFQDSLL